MKLKELRIARNMNQKELAEKLGYSQNTISQWESGKRTMDADTLARVADFFDTSVDTLLGRVTADYNVYGFEINAQKDKSDKVTSRERMQQYWMLLNTLGKQEAVKRVEELSLIPKYTAKDMPIASHNDAEIDDNELALMRQDIDEL